MLIVKMEYVNYLVKPDPYYSLVGLMNNVMTMIITNSQDVFHMIIIVLLMNKIFGHLDKELALLVYTFLTLNFLIEVKSFVMVSIVYGH